MTLLDADTRGNIVTLERPDCAQLFIVYAAALSRIMQGMNQMSFLRRSGLLRRNVIFIRDPETVVQGENVHSGYYEKGISPDLPDLDSVLDWQRAYIDSQSHVTEVYSLGNSFGGWSAMFFGYMLAVDKVYALAPAGLWGKELLRELMRDANGVTEYDIYYSREVEKDRDFAETFAGYPSTTLHTRDEYGHSMMRMMLDSGEIMEMIPPFRAAAPA